jgi:hypothetical protein
MSGLYLYQAHLKGSHMSIYKIVLYCTIVLYSGQAFGQLKTNVYAGGVNGIASMLNPRNSYRYRSMNGGLAIHNSAWGQLEKQQKQQLLATFAGNPTIMEIGFVNEKDKQHPDTWYANAKEYYIPYGIKPDFIQSNCFGNGYVPTLEEWKRFHNKYTQIMRQSKLFPIFEYQNYNKSTQLSNNKISLNANFQQITTISQGLVIDAPPHVFLKREDEYREWVIDALKYTKSQGHTCVLIVSPDYSNNRFKQDTVDMLNILHHHRALPDAYVVENYIFDWWWQKLHKRNYPNKIGRETDQNSIMGVAKFIKLQIN